MKRIIGVAAVGALAVALLPALGCGGSDSDSKTAAAPSEPRAPAAPAAPAAPREPAMPAAPAAPAGAGEAMNVVETCTQLAEQKQWLKALEPCTLAAKQRPDDLKIKHALQQAKAAAAQALGS